MGTPEFAVPILDTLIKNTEVVLVVTQQINTLEERKFLLIRRLKI